MIFRANGLRSLAISAAALAVLLATANLANASLSTVDQAANKQQVALAGKIPDVAPAKPAVNTQDNQGKEDQQNQQKDQDRKEKRDTGSKDSHTSSSTICSKIHGLCKVLRIQNSKPTLLRPARFWKPSHGRFFR
jgi:hypothetical protein